MLTWINFLHIYQPPTQSNEILDRVVRESYSKIPELLSTYNTLKLTMNISGSLLELLENNKYSDLLEKYKKYISEGRIEIVGSAMYHPILPLLPQEEIRRQIKLHQTIARRLFGDTYKPKGFFLPEMAYSKDVADIIKEFGFEWIILDEIHIPKNEKIHPDIGYSIKDIGLKVLFRNRKVSKTFPPEYIVEHIAEIESPLITAHDGELYGHWHKNDNGYYEKAFASNQIITKTVSEYFSEQSEYRDIEPRHASWESTEEELELGVSYALWDDPKNEIHVLLTSLKNEVMSILGSATLDPHYESARVFLDRGIASCAWWWATHRKLTDVSPITWNPTEIEKGGQELLNAVRTLKNLSNEKRLRIEQLFSTLREKIWSMHWQQFNK